MDREGTIAATPPAVASGAELATDGRAAADQRLEVRVTTSNGSWTAAFVLEQTLGHITHSANLRALVPPADPTLEAHIVPVEFAIDEHRIPNPIWSNWTVRAGLRARRGLRRLRRPTGDGRREIDAMFVHTQVPAVLLGRAMRRVPTVVSIDATPLQYDELGEFYAHDLGPRWLERAKFEANRRCFSRAAHLVTWSQWARLGLRDGYGIPTDKVSVIAPGVDLERWSRPADTGTSSDGPVRVLFVGGDLRRKGGDLLIEACRRLAHEPDLPAVELHLVTTADVEPGPGVVVHRSLTANSPGLIEQYHHADVFCLPTLGDCLPMVLAEAAASGLPLVSTDVGAISEIVRQGVTGELVPVGDVEALVAALRKLVGDRAYRLSCGREARALAAAEHDARANAKRIVDTLRTVAHVRPA